MKVQYSVIKLFFVVRQSQRGSTCHPTSSSPVAALPYFLGPLADQGCLIFFTNRWVLHEPVGMVQRYLKVLLKYSLAVVFLQSFARSTDPRYASLARKTWTSDKWTGAVVPRVHNI